MKKSFVVCLLFFSLSLYAMSEQKKVSQIKDYIKTCNRYLNEIVEFKVFKLDEDLENDSNFLNNGSSVLEDFNKNDCKSLKFEINLLKIKVDNFFFQATIKDDNQDSLNENLSNYNRVKELLKDSLKGLKRLY